jgi:hypothetical protein
VNAAGFVYFIEDPKPLLVPHLSFDGTYIVLSVHISHLDLMLSILRNEKPLQVRFFDPESTGVLPSAFIESTGNVAESLDGLSIFKQLVLKR